MATVPRIYLITSKGNVGNITPKNGQVIAIYDSDEIYYDVPSDGTSEGEPVRRKVSGIQIVDTLPVSPETDILYVHSNILKIWDGTTWINVGNYSADTNVSSTASDGKFYLVGTSDATSSNGTLLKNADVYVDDGVIYGSFSGNATTATTATKAINDNASTPKPITGYVNNVTGSGSIITVTKGDGTTSSITIPNTTYDLFSASSKGLVDKTAVVVVSDSTNLILTGSGWMNKANVSVGSATTATTATTATSATTATTATSATSATKDGSNNTITSTYIKNVAYNDSTGVFTVTKGDNTTISPAPTIPTVTSSKPGLAPAASGSGDTTKFLKGDGTWATPSIPNYDGTNPGAVPAASSGQSAYYLRGDATWGGAFATSVMGLVPAPTGTDDGKILQYDSTLNNNNGGGKWVSPTTATNTTNTAGATNDVTHTLYLTGSIGQQTGVATEGLVTYTNQYVYINGNRLYQSDGASIPSSVAVVDTSSTQTLTNKTYVGGTYDSYTLGDACSKTVATTTVSTSGSEGDKLPTNSAVAAYVNGQITTVNGDIVKKLDNSVVANIYSDSATYNVGDYCMYDVSTDSYGAMLYQCTTAISTAESFDSTKWSSPKLITDLTPLLVTLSEITGTTVDILSSSFNVNSSTTYNPDIAVATVLAACNSGRVVTLKAVYDNGGTTTTRFVGTLSYSGVYTITLVSNASSTYASRVFTVAAGTGSTISLTRVI